MGGLLKLSGLCFGFFAAWAAFGREAMVKAGVGGGVGGGGGTRCGFMGGGGAGIVCVCVPTDPYAWQSSLPV